MMGDKMNKHADSAGADCIEGADGCCTECGVSLAICDNCNGRGYHSASCQDNEADIQLQWWWGYGSDDVATFVSHISYQLLGVPQADWADYTDQVEAAAAREEV